MRKLTKGFLIFGVVTTVIGFILLFVGIQSDGIKSLLSMSKEPVYDSRTEELTFGKEVENLEITLHQHALTITDSFDDQIHISYHPSLSAHHDLVTNQNDKTLSLTDKKLSETPFLSSGIGGILHIASSYSRRFDEVILQLPKGRSLKGINVSANRGQTSITNASLENATINTNNGYLLRIEGSRIKNSKLTTPNIVNIFDTDITDSQLESTENHFHAENIQVHGKVELTAKDYLRIILDQKENQRINWDISSNYGSIFQFTREEPESRGTELSNPYKTEKTDVKDQLIARSDDDIELISTPIRR
ncbi:MULTISPECIES: DUF4097 domain-containing protein [Streptococcus]|uniref:DUF4097 domain-containing protein n=1 Tax=Streptococcus pseudopneumoniae TaxID=257758 RepID=A0A2P0A0M3_9STRE|nr:MULTISPECIES: DUF4097 domain-containing protein [Streptococcus]ETD99608.1 hypothetical protein U753_08890 [Streptococcus pseudopneumoniae 5247]MBF9665598.1 DUF4097 domain-containing protein [Streptococcus pseudopneumoniae]NIB91434.1 hypothetical protein [Streptococcus pseudopneumoniae]TMR84475.1 hypothetical protein E3V42_03040 [Streptococcus pseudopneumoniae]CEY61401.1 Uncharacterised protein [Streptococcus pseudopneumoniae]